MRLAFLAALAALVAASAAQAQVPDRAIGLGVSLSPTALLVSDNATTMMLPVGFGNIHIPIIAGPHLKIEPEVGIWRTSSSYQDSGYSSSSTTSTLLRVGVGVFGLLRVRGGTALYVGPRVAMVRSSESYKETGVAPPSSSQTNWSFGLALGGEHFFSPHFSLGGEVQLNHVTLGNTVYEPSGGPGPSVSNSLIANNGLIFIRLYL